MRSLYATEMESCSRFSRRILATDVPVMVMVQKLLENTKDVLSLAQGVVHWEPPQSALDKIKNLVHDPSTSKYGPDDGLPELRAALVEKLRIENKLQHSSVMVTAGANQAYSNLALALCDQGDAVVMFAPYYFNAYTTFQMTGITSILVGPCDPETCHPDPVWLENVLGGHEGKLVPKIVTIVNPGNPSGTYVPEPLLKRISDLCKHAGAWLIMDNTYEYFMYDGNKHICIEGDHVVNIFSFSKAWGMMGWRVGYIAYPSSVKDLGTQLLKVQDNVPICASIIGQKLALAALEIGPTWVQEKVESLYRNREIVLRALSALGKSAIKGGEGAIYLWAKLPDNAADDVAVVQWLVKHFKVMVIPGSACGVPGYIRVSYGGLTESACKIAAERLQAGMEQLVKNGALA